MIVYRAESPSGKVYIGITKTSLTQRWTAHCGRARQTEKRHPLWDAIRKYGREAFSLSILAETDDVEIAKTLEQQFIRLEQSQDREHGYNVSPGGDYDGATGAKVFWDAMRADPEARASYINGLRARKLRQDWSDYDRMGAAAQLWREQNPGEAHALAMRGLEKANARNREKLASGWRPKGKPLSEEQRAVMLAGWRRRLAEPEFRAHKSETSRQNAQKLWAGRSSEEIAALGAKIGDGLRKAHASATDEDRASQAAQLAKARSNIDHEYRKARQREALKAYWTPERRAEVSRKRKGRYADAKSELRNALG